MADKVQDPVFTFAIITDTHIKPAGGDLSSPYPVNDKANARARYATALIEAAAPAFTVHLGDMVHPLPHLPTYGAACAEALDIFAPIVADMHFVPGNHDIGDKPAMTSPAGPVTPDAVDGYETVFGEAYYAVDHDDVRLLVINSSLVNSGLDMEQKQARWLEKALDDARGARTVIFSHYPPFIDTPDEPEHYDNFAEPGRSWFLNLCAVHKVEAVFSGHVHQFFFNRYRDTKLYCLPPTSFTRQDYAALYPGDPGAEYGRDDADKFGVMLVDVYADGHALRAVPTGGREAAPGTTVTPRLPKRAVVQSLIPHMRHSWARAVDLPYNGPMEEFSRKRARNDYPLLRLWQMGIDVVRTPLADLDVPEIRRRIEDWITAGIKFRFFSEDGPDEQALGAIENLGQGVAGFELVRREADDENLLPLLGHLYATLTCPLALCGVTTSADEHREDGGFAHNVSAGFLWKDRTKIEKALAAHPNVALVFRLSWAEPLEATFEEAARFSAETGRRIEFILQLASGNPAVANFDEPAIVTRVTNALAHARELPLVSLQLDTFATVDRGYSPRTGLIDTRSNLTELGKTLAGTVW